MAGRFDTSRRPPPVRIGLAAARYQQARMLEDTERMALAAGNYGQREARFGNVPIALRIHTKAGPNSPLGVKGAKPLGRTIRKRGYPPITGSGPTPPAVK
jgi:hypothetical protein